LCAVDTQAGQSPGGIGGELANVASELISPLPTTTLAIGSAELESGALGRNLQMLGNRLRESIKRQAFEPTLIGAVEWAIDRHHLRAIEHLSAGLDHDPEVAASLRELIASKMGDEHGDGESNAARSSDRLLRIVRAVAPHLLSEGDADACEPVASTGRGSPSVLTRQRELGAAAR
jgi:hypothetical protein